MNNKRWSAKGFPPSSVSKLVDVAIFREKGKGTFGGEEEEHNDEFAFDMSEPTGTTTKAASKKWARKNKTNDETSGAVSPAASRAKSRQSKVDSDIESSSGDMQIDDDTGAAVIDLGIDEPKRKKVSVEERPSAPASLRPAPPSSKKVFPVLFDSD